MSLVIVVYLDNYFFNRQQDVSVLFSNDIHVSKQANLKTA